MGQVISAEKDTSSGLYNIEIRRSDGTVINDYFLYRYTVPSNIIEYIKTLESNINLMDPNLPYNQETRVTKLMAFHASENLPKVPGYNPSKPTYLYFQSRYFNFETLSDIYAMETNNNTMPAPSPPEDYPFAIDPCPPDVVCKGFSNGSSTDNSLYMYIIIGVIVVILAMMLWR